MEGLVRGLEAISKALGIPLLRLGDTQLTLWLIVYVVVFLAVLVYLTRRLRLDRRGASGSE